MKRRDGVPIQPTIDIGLSLTEVLAAKTTSRTITASITCDQMKEILIQHVTALGFKVVPNSIVPTTHTEGEYEDAIQMFDGFQFSIEADVTVSPPKTKKSQP